MVHVYGLIGLAWPSGSDPSNKDVAWLSTYRVDLSVKSLLVMHSDGLAGIEPKECL